MTAGIIILVSVIAIVGAIAAYYIARHLKGSIDLDLPETSFSYGDEINGEFTVTAKKEIEGNSLFVAVIGEKVTESRDDDGSKSRDSEEIYRKETRLEGRKVYPAGFTNTYQFQAPIPLQRGNKIRETAVGQAIEFISHIMDAGDEFERIDWKLEVRLDAKGVDLSTSEKIFVD